MIHPLLTDVHEQQAKGLPSIHDTPVRLQCIWALKLLMPYESLDTVSDCYDGFVLNHKHSNGNPDIETLSLYFDDWAKTLSDRDRVAYNALYTQWKALGYKNLYSAISDYRRRFEQSRLD